MSGLPSKMHSDRIAACFNASLSSGLVARLAGESRLSGRLADLVGNRYQLDDGVEAAEHGQVEADHLLSELSLKEIEGLALRAGVVFHAKSFVREIRGPVLSALAERFGAEALEDARRHVDLAADIIDNRLDLADLGPFEAAIERDGVGCLAAWIGDLPLPLRRRVQLKWPNDAAMPVVSDAEAGKRGPAIIRRLVQDTSR